MKYRVILFMSERQLAAIDVNQDGEADTIGLDGNCSIEYETDEEIKNFSEKIKNYYNIDAFSDIDISLSVVNFNAKMRSVQLLFHELEDASDTNVLNVEKILPFMVLREVEVQPNTEYCVNVFDLDYRVVADSKLAFECSLEKGKGENIALTLDKFAWLYKFQGNPFMANDEKYEALRAELDKTVGEKQETIQVLSKQLEEQKKKFEKKFKERQKKLEEYKLQAEKLEAQENKRKAERRVICTFEVEETSSFEHKIHKSIFRYKVADGDIVDRGMCLIEIKEKGRLSSSYCPVRIKRIDCEEIRARVPGGVIALENWEVGAPKDGKIFLLYAKEAEGKKQIPLKDYSMDYAIIGDVTDTREEALEWYKGECERQALAQSQAQWDSITE